MSGTRSRFPRAPATEALIVAHGQPSDPAPADAATVALAARIEALADGCRVRGATLALPGALETALAAASVPPVVYPLFMSDGWFTTTELPRRLGTAAGPVLPPLGLDPGLADIGAGAVRALAASRGWPLEALTVVIAAHGSERNGRPALAAREFAERLGRLLPEPRLRLGFVDQSPSIAEAASEVGPYAICLPFFAASGGHFRNDIPAELETVGFNGILMDPIGDHPALAKMVAGRIGEALNRLCQTNTA